MDIKKIVSNINDNYNKIMEHLVISLISGWFITGILFSTYKKVEDIEYIKDMNVIAFLLVIVLTAAVVAILRYLNKNLADIVMFASVFIYSILSIYENERQLWFCIGMIVISVMALYYVKDSILEITNKVKIEDNRIGIAVMLLLGLALTIYISIFTVYRYKTYSNSTFDFGIFAQMFENMKNTFHPTTTVERPEMGLFSHFGVHFSPIFYVVLPIYFIFSSAETIQIMQALALGVAVVPLFFLCRHYQLSVKFSILMCTIYCFIPAVASGTNYDFHENCFIPVLLLSMILALEKQKDILLVIFAALLLMVKEDAALYVLVVGAYFLMSGRDKKRGIILSVVSLIYFAIAMKIIHSYGIGDLASTRYGNVMYDQSKGLPQIVLTVLANASYTLQEIMNEEKLTYLILMILPMSIALVQRKNYSRYLLLGTFVVFNLVPKYQYMHDIGFQYHFGAVVLMIYIAVMTVAEWKQDQREAWGMAALVMTFILFVGFTFPTYKTYVERYDQHQETYRKMDRAIESIPADAKVLTSGFMMPHFYYVADVTVINEQVEIDHDYIVIDLRPGYSDDWNVIGARITEDYTLIEEVQDAIKVFRKNN